MNTYIRFKQVSRYVGLRSQKLLRVWSNPQQDPNNSFSKTHQATIQLHKSRCNKKDKELIWVLHQRLVFGEEERIMV